MIVLKIALSVETVIFIIQELFIGNHEISHNEFNFYWPQSERKNIRIMTVVRKNLADKMMVNHRIDLINHIYFILLKI